MVTQIWNYQYFIIECMHALNYDVQKTVMPKRSVFVAVGNICEKFTNDLKHISNGIILGYHVKRELMVVNLLSVQRTGKQTKQ